ncbi:MAG: prenyltransferase/squalene oxidase repeat-containing protein, partial [Verrucomicrobiota bacterium]
SGHAEESAVGYRAEAIELAIDRGIDFLVSDQNANGSWGSATRTKGLNIYAPVPGAHDAFRGAVTSMVISALIESGDADSPGAAADSLADAQTFLLEELPTVRRATTDAIYNVWTHMLALRALADWYPRADPEMQLQLVELINQQIGRLIRYESVDGGWGYYDFRYGTQQPSSSSISFVNATGLISLHEVREIPGVEIPDRLVKRAIAATNRQRKPDHTYLYGEYLKTRPMRGVNRPGGSLARSQACNAALRMWGDDTVTDEVLEEWLIRLRDRNGWLDIGRKRPIPHEAWFQVAGYFYFYGHYYAGRCIEILPSEERPFYQELLADLILPLQEKDGSWWDYPLYDYHQPYGTAYAIMTLVRCRDESTIEK